MQVRHHWPVDHSPGRNAGIRGQTGDYRTKVKPLAGDVEQDSPVGCKLPKIQRHRLPRQQVHRDTVGTECIDNQSIIGCIRCIRYHQAGVTQHDRCTVSAGGEEAEIARIARNLLDHRVNLVERPLLARLCVTTECSRPKPDHRDALQGLRKCPEKPSEGTVWTVIGCGQRFFTG
jgi:hypothetical protein